MTTEQTQVVKLSKVLDGVIVSGCLVLIISSLAMVAGITISSPDPVAVNLHLGLLGSLLLVSASTVAGIIGHEPYSLAWGAICSKVTAIRSRAIEATDWSFLSPDTLLFTSGKGEISELITISSIQLIIPPPPLEPTSVIDLGPGFIYVMRRADGIYKLGRAINPTQRLMDHQSTYKQDIKLIRCFAVSDMVAFERAALSMTKLYAYKREAGRKELRKMTKKQLYHFLVEFGELVSVGTIKNIKKAAEVTMNGRTM